MINQVKALILALGVASLVLIFFQRPFAATIGSKRYATWRNLFIVITVAAFLTPNFWLFIGIVMIVVLAMSIREPIKPALFLLLLFAVPMSGAYIPGFAGINRFINITPQAAFATVTLVPAMLVAKHMRPMNRAGKWADIFFIGFILIQFFLAFRSPTFTHMLRTFIQAFLLMAPFYYVFSRYPRSLNDMRILTGALLLGILIAAAMTIPETLRGWDFYTQIPEKWFGFIPYAYAVRAGFLRASGTVMDPILMGSVVMMGIGIALAFTREKFSSPFRLVVFGLLGLCLLLPFSRGPWVGAVVMFVTFIAIGPKPFPRLIKFAAGAVFLGILSLPTPLGSTVIRLLPFIGSGEGGTITYRQDLFNASMEVIRDHPFLGTPDYLIHPAMQPMRQGQGIIDIVNTYLLIALQSGIVGLTLFVGVFACALWGLLKAARSAIEYNEMLALYCRAYFATLVGMLVTILTVSNILQFPLIYWSLAGLAVALVRIEKEERAKYYSRVETEEEEPSLAIAAAVR